MSKCLQRSFKDYLKYKGKSKCPLYHTIYCNSNVSQFDAAIAISDKVGNSFYEKTTGDSYSDVATGKYNDLAANLFNTSQNIPAKYSKSNKNFMLVSFSINKISFIIKPHVRTIYLRTNANKEKLKTMLCSIPMTLMVYNPINEITHLFVVEKVDSEYNFIAWPYGNVFDNGKICMGSVNNKDILDYHRYIMNDGESEDKFIDVDMVLEILYNSFFSSVFNRDLSSKNIELLECAYKNKIKNKKSEHTIEEQQSSSVVEQNSDLMNYLRERRS